MKPEAKYYRIGLLFNANKVYDRGVVEGIGQYLQASQCNWNIVIEDDFVYHKEMLQDLSLDGIIADFDDIDTANLLKDTHLPIVAVGGSYANLTDYPHFPYVATNNHALIELAFSHLKQKGISNFAFYGLATDLAKHWSKERQTAFDTLMRQNQYPINIYLDEPINADNWRKSQEKLCQWIQSLPKHTGIIAVTDARARHLLQACEYLKIAVPDQLCVIGIDNEELIQYLSRVSLSSVVQETKQIGYHAAKMLDNLLQGKTVSKKPLIISPTKVEQRASTDYRSLHDPLVIQAMHYIRHQACQGIKTEQVLDYLRISRSNLEQRFKNEMNKTIHRVIHEEKLQRAKYMLKFTNVSIQEIAEVCGYPSLQYFYAVFRKEFDQTPKEFRDI